MIGDVVVLLLYIAAISDPVNATNGVNDHFCAPVGGSATLMAFTDITGNPEPQSLWVLTGGTARGDTTSRQLTITNLTPADSGNYTNILTNTLNGTDNRSINSTVELRVQSKFMTLLQFCSYYNYCKYNLCS